MNKKGGIVMVLLLMLVVIVITSAVVLILVKNEIIGVNPEYEDVSLLDAEFVPVGSSGSLVIKNFKFCGMVDEGYTCIGEGNSFSLGDDVHFTFIVESSTFQGDVMLIENYLIKGPNGDILLDIDEKRNYNFETASSDKLEAISFKDYFTAGFDLIEGEYSLELLIENPLIDKRARLVKNFILVERTYEEYWEPEEGELEEII